MHRSVIVSVRQSYERSLTFSIKIRLPTIVLLRLDDNGILHEINNIDMNLLPVTFTGDIIALSETVSTMVIYNWKTGTRAYLDEGGDTQYGHRVCLQVVFTSSTILVVRACSISAYVSPLLLCGQTQTPIATHPFGWVEDFSISSPAPNNPLSILIRYEDLDFGPSVPSSLELYSLSSFPPILTSKISSYCTQFVLGKRATAMCVRYKEHDIDRKTLIAVVFPGPLNPTDQVRIREVYPLDRNWSALDYDEDTGRIAIYSGYGKITILQL